MTNLQKVFEHTDWMLLRDQKTALLVSLDETPPETSTEEELLAGLVNWIDALQDAAEKDGFPVQFSEESPCRQ